MLKTLVFLLCSGVVFAKWGDKSCPSTCTCQVSELREDLMMTSWDSDEDAPQLHPNEALHLTEGAKINFHGMMKTAVCVYQSNIGLDEWMQQLPADVEALTIMQAPGGGKVVMEEHHLHAFATLILLDIQGAANSTLMVIKSNALRPLRTLQYLSLRNIRFQGQPEVTPPRPPVQYSLHELPSDVTQWKSMQPVIPHEIHFVTADEPMPYPEYKSAMEHADMSVFSGLERLRVLRVDSCGITEIKWQMFQGLRSLEWLSLERNELLYVPDFAFFGAPHLKQLSLAHNRILSMHFTNLAGLLELERLDMSFNNLSHLSELSLPPLPQLLEADLRHNPLEAVYKATFEIMNRTEKLYLGGATPLRLLESGLSGLESLRTLVITNAKSRSLDQSTLKGISKLKKLQVQGQVKELSYDAFSQAAKLEQLILRDCNIELVSMDAFYGLYGLLVLDLSDNKLSDLPPGIFDQLGSLKELQLQNNQFTTLPEDIFMQLNSKMIRLDGNPWHCSCAMKEWRPMSVNKVKVLVDRTIQNAEIKGGAEMTVKGTQYRFEKTVAPICDSPAEYRGWSVFQALRKELKCSLSEAKKEFIERRRFEIKKIAGAGKNYVSRLILNDTKIVKEGKISKIDKVGKAVIVSSTPKTLVAEISNEVPEEVKPVKKEQAKPVAIAAPDQENSKTMAMVHQGNTIKLSKKAWKFEVERKKQEKLKKLQLLDAQAFDIKNTI